MRKIGVFTGTRAEFGLLYWLLKDIEKDPELDLKLFVSGMHLSPEFGLTYKSIESEGFKIDEKIETLLSSNSKIGVAKSIGLGVLGYTDALSRQKPDALVILGDRFEALAIAQTAMILGIPIVHLHGGEITEGAYDDAIRHAITKLSYLHMTSTDEHKRRVIQLGEAPERVFNVGAIGLDHLNRGSFMSVDELSDSLGFVIKRPYMLVTYHPVTLADEDPETSFKELLDSLSEFPEYQVILTYPNADNGGRSIIPLLENYANTNSERVIAIPSLGQKRYLSAVKHSAAVIGNSSSGIIEVPSLDVATINIGMRQKGRLAAKSVIHCKPYKKDIVNAIHTGITQAYKTNDEEIRNPYGQGDTSSQIITLIKKMTAKPYKSFYDLNVEI
ncbi:MAG: UDP-N-acetylglucosamine 2-epimerase (hydrolyzing) [Alteromonadaceae bacterium]|uniref:Polysialic acid biosynthesis protein P7 n=1 Tax=Paraglaciecola agarilytica NO2 TaxID=1125747 RepID=A0ABQ0IBY8_9ALTE|nr:UDP-N-acetylglucosamine 2-epimerase [Paraglaciecola agarilytica]MBN25739.1 UDP-N-acetylglucosamine 2-epimerase (hydrolyzing) [Alteromonadaceae bacterium]GAC06783.1 polysialic acid biosynthesis protein P7 [Paraglaciecola agarilytica NO2]|tara:strand:+ start:151886 stop:153046 length:1161 start_codon:yes stop_codon:yes gene_type:complete